MKRFNSRLIWLALAAMAGVLALSGCLAPATGTTETGSSATQNIYLIVVMVAIFAIFYFLTIRPQRKRQKEQQKLIEELKKGDRVITIGGLYGTVESNDEESVTLKVESGTIRVVKNAIHHKIIAG